ncbi:MAG: preprotein translocase subunit SecG, partial [Oscillospiraceae bacterium]
MNVLEIIGGVLMILTSILIIALVVSQDSKKSGLSSLGGSSADSYIGNNSTLTPDVFFAKLTKIVAVAFFI